ncbi:hypothetical protein AgCh_021310 [Apium graveolens]
MNRTKLSIREWIGNVPQFPIGVDAAVAEAVKNRVSNLKKGKENGNNLPNPGQAQEIGEKKKSKAEEKKRGDERLQRETSRERERLSEDEQTTSEVAQKGARKGSLFVADLDSANEDGICCFYTKASVEQSKLLHKNMSHLNYKAINTLVKKELVIDMPNLEFAQDEEFAVARTTQQNGVVERKNRTLVEAARTMLQDANLPTSFWEEAVNTAWYTQNRFTIFVISSALSLRSLLDAHKLTGPNFADWLRNLRIVLRVEKLEYVLDSPKPTEPANDAHNDEHVVYHKWIDDANVAQCIMLASMNIELQKQHEHMDAHTILMHLQELYDVAGRTARYEISKELFGCRMSEGSSVNGHGLFSQFVVNFHMNKLDVSLAELHNMLKTAESNFPPKKSSVLLIGEGSNPKIRKRNPSKKKKVGEEKPVPPKAEDPKSKVVCFHCNKVGHWKRNCKVYLAELKKKKGSETTASDSGMFMIEMNMSLSQISTWVLDTACGSYICNSLQGIRRSRTLEEEEVILLMGNGARVVAEDVGSFHLHMPTGKTII